MDEGMPMSELDDWTLEATASLILDPIDLDGDFLDYGNGRHRARAMMDQRVSHTVATWYVPDGEPPAPRWVHRYRF